MTLEPIHLTILRKGDTHIVDLAEVGSLIPRGETQVDSAFLHDLTAEMLRLTAPGYGRGGLAASGAFISPKPETALEDLRRVGRLIFSHLLTEPARKRLRAAGVTLRIIEQVALLADVIGNPNLQTDRIGVTVPQFVSLKGKVDELPSQEGLNLSDFRRVSRKLRTDIIDLNVGFKTNPLSSVVGFATVFVPLTDDGLRADAILAVGLEMSF